MLIDSLRELSNDLDRLNRQIADIERRLQTWMKEGKACKSNGAIPGGGLLTATATLQRWGTRKRSGPVGSLLRGWSRSQADRHWREDPAIDRMTFSAVRCSKREIAGRRISAYRTSR